MIRWLLVGLLLLGLGTGLQKGWLIVDWRRMGQDLNIPSLKEGQAGSQSEEQPSR
jgi:hypothetical protein